MKKIILGFGLALAAAVYFLVQPGPATREDLLTPVPDNSLKTLDKPPTSSINELAKRKIKPNLKRLAVKDTSVHPCTKIIDPLVDGTFEEIIENSEEFYANLKDPSCQRALLPILKNNPQLLELEKSCLKNVTRDCDPLIFFLKTWAVSLTYPNNIDLAELDETILANKLMYNFTANPALPLEVLDQNIKILDEMISKNPSLFGAQKAKLIHLFAKEFQFNLNVEEEFMNTLDSLNSLKSDRGIDELLLVRDIGNKKLSKEKILKDIDNFIQKYPESPKGLYYRAALEYNLRGNPSGARNWLEKAKNLAPNDPQVLHTLEKLKTAKPNQTIFYFSLPFNLEEV